MTDKLIELLRNARHVGCLTGAGVSTLCGIPDFRGPQGLYKNPDAERIFDIDWFDRDPSVYYRGCADLVYGLARFEPGPVHRALRHLEEIGKLKGIATQIIEMLKTCEVPRCTCGGAFKPDITFFGEALPEEAFHAAQELAIRSDVFLVLGTSLTVFPAAGLPRLTLQAGGKVVVVNAQPTSLDDYAALVCCDLAAFAEAVEGV